MVRIAGVEGTVEDLTLRRTTLRDFAGNVHTVPNSAVIVASNLTRGYAVISEDIHVPSAELVEPATDAINGVGRALADDPKWADLVLEPPHVERIDALGASGITLRVSGRVLAGNRWSFAGELRRRLLEAFRDAGPAPRAVRRPGAARRLRRASGRLVARSARVRRGGLRGPGATARDVTPSGRRIEWRA